MSNISDLIKDNDFVVELLNGPCPPKGREETIEPINPDWIDPEASEIATEAFRKLLPEGIPYITRILAERNPDTICNGTAVDANEKRMRYFVLALIPDTEHPYNYSFPLIHMMWTVSLDCWEIIRAVLASSVEDSRVMIAKQPFPPILNNARICWSSLYIGKQPYVGIQKLSEQWMNADEYDGLEGDVHLYDLRKMKPTELLQKLIDAYDADNPEETASGETVQES